MRGRKGVGEGWLLCSSVSMCVRMCMCAHICLGVRVRVCVCVCAHGCRSAHVCKCACAQSNDENKDHDILAPRKDWIETIEAERELFITMSTLQKY